MPYRRSARLAWVLWAGTIVLSIGYIPLLTPVHAALPDALPFVLRFVGDACSILLQLAFALLGALIVTRRPQQGLGWLFCAIGLAGAADSFAGNYALYTLLVAPGTLPGGLVAAWFQNWDWLVGISLLLFFLPLLFPTGRLVSARWRFVGWLMVGAVALQCLLVAFEPGPLGNFFIGRPAVANPLGVAAFDGPLPTLLRAVLHNGPLLLLAAASSLLVRLHRARGEERQQIKWFVYAGAIAVVLWVVQALIVYALHIAPPTLEILLELGVSGSFLAMPLAIGIAIFKYRLYDIDLIINRTLVYGALTASLALTYLGLVFGLQDLLRGLIHQTNDVAIVLSTLTVAALFQPWRSRLQAIIDRRFYRRKYDAAKIIEAFSATLRNEVDLAHLSEQLVLVVQETMQPASISLWMRPVKRQTAWGRTSGESLSRGGEWPSADRSDSR
jgi:hypothetical protein